MISAFPSWTGLRAACAAAFLRAAFLLTATMTALCLLIVASPSWVSAGPRIVAVDGAEASGEDETPSGQGDSASSDGEASEARLPVSQAARRTVSSRDLGDGVDLGAAFALLTVLDDWLDGERVGLAGGYAATVRWRYNHALALTAELGHVFREAEDGASKERRFQAAVGLAWFGIRSPMFALALTGGGLTSFATLEHDTRGPDEWLEVGGYLGVGAELQLETLNVWSELRASRMHRTDGPELRATQADRNDTRPAPEARLGLLWHLGVNFSVL